MEVLEIPPVKGCQDQTFVANVAVSIEPYIILANYKAAGRACEVAPAKTFFEKQGYKCIQPPFDFEGSADCKKLKEGLYFGGIGQFSSPRAFKWIEEQTGVKIALVREINPRAYHADCCLFVIDEENVIVNRSGLSGESIKTIEKYANVIEQPKGLDTTGITNAIKIPRKNIILSGTFNPEQTDYRKSMEWIFVTMDKFGIAVVLVDTDAVDPSGADASCCVLNLDF